MNYPAFVDSGNIKIETETVDEISFRYELSLPILNGSEKTALVIMMNPAEADNVRSDSTIDRVIRYFEKNEMAFGRVVIGNLYPIYEQNSANLQQHKEQLSKNLKHLEKLIKAIDHIYLGWGKPEKTNTEKLISLEYHETALKVIDLAIDSGKTCCVRGIRDELYPMHLGRMGYKERMVECDLLGLKRKLEIKIELSNKS
ncbi:DUF1643 domain-containing protein [Photobacterium lipolyticum]|uniref:DUF1643 domain-containing protein n=1 Tax=Photobacterium lipolyticum TaxID=266810 RepID=UPI001474C003|nr:DUF1643 domain-containing protein [Photobacterium lipolyticum]